MDAPDLPRLDAHAQRRLVEQLEAAEHRNRVLLETLPEVILECDSSERLIYLNPAWKAHLGYAPRSSLGKTLPEFISVEDADQWPGFPELGGPDRTLELRLRTKGGKDRWFFVGLRTSREGQRWGLLQDIHHRIQLEHQLRQSQKMEALGRVAGGVAHDFNNLLTVIIGGSEAVLDALPESESDLRIDLEAVIEAGERASDITRQLLAFGRAQVMNTRVVPLMKIVEASQKTLGRLIPPKIGITTENHSESGLVHIDPVQIQQVIMNLAINSRDAMPRGGQIRFEIRDAQIGAEPEASGLQEGSYVVLSVSDTGNGISPNDIERIFEPFFTTKETGKGTGLGLAMCYGIVRQNHGGIDVQSQLGRGTTVRIFLPASSPPSPNPA